MFEPESDPKYKGLQLEEAVHTRKSKNYDVILAISEKALE